MEDGAYICHNNPFSCLCSCCSSGSYRFISANFTLFHYWLRPPFISVKCSHSLLEESNKNHSSPFVHHNSNDSPSLFCLPAFVSIYISLICVFLRALRDMGKHRAACSFTSLLPCGKTCWLCSSSVFQMFLESTLHLVTSQNPFLAFC